MKMRYSLVIPVYNAERTIAATLTSVLKQTHAFDEILLVDNNSIDSSAVICKDIAHGNTNITYLFQEVPGVSAARNLGITHAKSEYVLFLDDDDIMLENLLEEVHRTIIKQPLGQLVHYNFYHEYLNGIVEKNKYILPAGRYTGNDFLSQSIAKFGDEMKHMVWSFAFPKSLFVSGEYSFNTDVTMFEDILLLQQIFRADYPIDVIDAVLVEYKASASSLSQSGEMLQLKNFTNVLEILHTSCVITAEQIDYFQRLGSKILGYKNYVTFIGFAQNIVPFRTKNYIALKIARIFRKIVRKLQK